MLTKTIFCGVLTAVIFWICSHSNSCGADVNQVTDQVPTVSHDMLRGVDKSITNDIPKWVAQLKDKEQKKRLEGASNLFISALLDKKRMKDEKSIGGEIVTAYKRETRGEIKLAMLATLDVLDHSALPGLLEDASKDSDPEIRNMVKIIREKQYLKPIVIENPDINRKAKDKKTK